MFRIDAHVHVFARHSPDYPREVNDLYPAEREATLEQLMAVMDRHGVDKAVLIQLGGYRDRHRYLAECLRRAPDRLAGVGLVDLEADDPAAELAELVETTGIKGLRLFQLGKPEAADVRELACYPLWPRAAELGVVMCLYPRAAEVHWVEKLVREFPGVTVALDHLGMCPAGGGSVDEWGRPRLAMDLPPPTLPTILRLAAYPNVYVKLSGEYAFTREGYPYRDLQPVVQALYDAFGPDRLMWATDFPWILTEPGYGPLTGLIDLHLPHLSADERAAILGGTAAWVWGWTE